MSDSATLTYTDRIDSVDELVAYIALPDEVAAAVLPPARRLLAAARALGQSAHATLLRMDLAHRLRLGQDHIFARTDGPVAGYVVLLDAAATCLEGQVALPLLVDQIEPAGESEEVLDATAQHYGRLWRGFSPAHYFQEATDLLRTRMERGGIDLRWFEGKRVLDCGCGGGRYTVALKALGCALAVGVDWSEEALEMARQRAAAAGIQGVEFHRANVLDLPFDSETFDFVFSNGVLHHTQDVERGVRELVRVMRADGQGWLYLYGRPGGLDRLTHYLARLLLKGLSREVCRRYCHALGLAGNKTFFLLDLWLTPVAECYTPAEVEGMLERAGCRQWRRLVRGSDQDLVEQLWRGGSDGAVKFGVGENRYVFKRKRS